MEVGQQLFEARQGRHLTLADISRTTKIPVHLLEAIERNDIDHLPPRLFARAFVRAYANEVGVNPDLLLDTFENPEIEPSERELPIPNVTVEEPASSRPLFFVLALSAACSLYFGFTPKTSPTEQPQADIAKPLQLAPDRAEVITPTAPPANADVVFQIQSHGGCVVAVTADGHQVASRLMPPGQPLTVKARGEIILRVGDTSSCTTTAVDPTILPARRAAYVPAAELVVAGSAAEPSLAKSVAADDPVVLASPPDSESSPATSDAVIPLPDQAPPPALVEQF